MAAEPTIRIKVKNAGDQLPPDDKAVSYPASMTITQLRNELGTNLQVYKASKYCRGAMTLAELGCVDNTCLTLVDTNKKQKDRRDKKKLARIMLETQTAELVGAMSAESGATLETQTAELVGAMSAESGATQQLITDRTADLGAHIDETFNLFSINMHQNMKPRPGVVDRIREFNSSKYATRDLADCLLDLGKTPPGTKFDRAVALAQLEDQVAVDMCMQNIKDRGPAYTAAAECRKCAANAMAVVELD